MAFSVPEVRDELLMLGHANVPDHVIIDFLSQTQHYDYRSADPSSSYADRKPSSDVDSYAPVRGGKSSREVHGQPVPGDRDFRRSNQRSDNNNGGGLDSLCFTPHFAAEVEEMRKMLRIMEGTKEQIFGSRNSRNRLKQAIGVLGLADEHEHYVGKLFSDWRVVGKVMRCKSKEKHEAGIPSVSEGSEILEEDDGPASNSTQKKPAVSGRFDIRADSAGMYNDVASEDIEDVEKDEHLERPSGGRAKAESTFSAESNGEERPTDFGDDEGEEILSKANRARAKGTNDYDTGGPVTIDKFESDAGPRRRISAGGTGEFLWADSSSEGESSTAHEGGIICDKSIYDTSSHNGEDGLDSSFDMGAPSLEASDTDPERTLRGPDTEGLRDPGASTKVYRSPGSSKLTHPISVVIPTDRENPMDSSSLPRTPDRRHSDHHCPLNDRSNIPMNNEQKRVQRRATDEGRARLKPWVTGSNTPDKSPKRMQSFGRRDRSESRAIPTQPNIPEDSLDRALAKSPQSSLPSSLRKGSGKGSRPAEKTDARTLPRGKADNDASKAQGEALKGVSDPSNHLEFTPQHTLPPIKVDKGCGVAEARHTSCAVCAARHARNGDSSPYGPPSFGSRSPFGGASSPGPLSRSASAKTYNGPDASPKQQRKPSAFNPVPRDARNPNFVVKTNGPRPTPSEILADSDRAPFRRQSSVRSSADSFRSGVPGSSNESKSGLETPVLSRSATTQNERSRVSKVTPGGPRRGGKVDRVARFAEMQNLWKSDKFLKASGKRKTQSFHRIFSELHESHERFYAAFRERCGIEEFSVLVA
ncbi:hypothetical protein MPTK1_5g11440 [Marchantia polymorpha subsp. ruderalis]|uniref:Uncharacterized protein n=2 Tax=Marchantia polymorpha TaxID=3197 RepID=A0A176VD02_MARPO|nr:hypothetical protein AXG93_2396s1420 [Marchantia polymorpha subsp. ruderalis]PTQ32997.1 hypothetical protein MARPO_0093s0067 [Marchantia polymorpha]BBN11385.1 hypothetical protein Mp_5g11440 [Marchantia polymorpha subsp. ruderalis]|eukprot:PTQ32997.1 hypothetical protein MARPO_0093s0067 [Marchantia polymorpha]